MDRRIFIQTTLLAGIGLSLPFGSVLKARNTTSEHSEEFQNLVFGLLKDWLDGMIKIQIINPADPKVHGMLKCPACEVVHTRLMDAVHPFLYMAKASGDKKYLDAGIALMEWGDNVSRPDGAWTNELQPKSWDGITVFGAIALGEALYYHGDLLDDKRKTKWTNRLKDAAEFCYKKFAEIDRTNINYGATNMYAMNLLGRLLNEPKYTLLSKKLANDVKVYFTKENTFLFGEIKPFANKKSAKGLQGIDLGYNVEESLNGIAMYALQEKDNELINLTVKSLNTHIEFMNPDGGWDNSWGTRMYKWTYWGSRTCDGCQPAYGLMAAHNPAFGTAAVKNTELLKKCTADGLLFGGLHFKSADIKPCVHHTFAHAKPLAVLLDHWEHLPEINKKTPLPREIADGVKYYKELDVSLFSRGNWRGTVSTYDAEYKEKSDCRQATGGALALLYHKKVGLLCVASMAIYKMVETYNQQEAPGEDIALTPRIETFVNNTWYTNLFDLKANHQAHDDNKTIEIKTKTQLKNEAREIVSGTASDFLLTYNCTKSNMQIIVETKQDVIQKTAFVLPLISPNNELTKQEKTTEICIYKPEGIVKISANAAIGIKEMPKSRTFNMVPGFEAIPLTVFFEKNINKLEINVSVV